MVDFFINKSFRSRQHGCADCLAPLSASLYVPSASAQQR